MLHYSPKVLLIIFLLFFAKISAQEYTLESPNGKISVKVKQSNSLSYKVLWKDKSLLNSSVIGINIKQEGILPAKNAKVSGKSFNFKHETIMPPYGMNRRIVNEYNELQLDFGNKLSVLFRAYNDGVAYRIITNFDKDIIIENEQVEYNFASNPTVYFPKVNTFFNSFDDNFKPVKLNEIKTGDMGNMPILIKSDNLPFMLISESDQWNYPGMFVQKSEGKSFKVVFPKYPVKEKKELPGRLKLTKTAWLSQLKVKKTADYIAKTKGKRNFPWRVLIIAENDNDLMNNELVYKLASPSKLENTDWIKPGKVAWDWYNHNELVGVDFKTGINRQPINILSILRPKTISNT